MDHQRQDMFISGDGIVEEVTSEEVPYQFYSNVVFEQEEGPGSAGCQRVVSYQEHQREAIQRAPEEEEEEITEVQRVYYIPAREQFDPRHTNSLSYSRKRKNCDPMLGGNYDQMLDSSSVCSSEMFDDCASLASTSDMYDDDRIRYMRQLEKKYWTRPSTRNRMQSVKPVYDYCMASEEIHKRLVGKTECDLETLSCCFPMCGRVFESIQVLAWHLSYSHTAVTQVYTKNRDTRVCLVCGNRWGSVKGKNVHLLSKHRDIASEHNLQCIEQRTAVIAPDAPAAHRVCREVFYEVDPVDLATTYFI